MLLLAPTYLAKTQTSPQSRGHVEFPFFYETKTGTLNNNSVPECGRRKEDKISNRYAPEKEKLFMLLQLDQSDTKMCPNR